MEKGKSVDCDRLRNEIRNAMAADRESLALELSRYYLKQRPDDRYILFLLGEALRIVGRLVEAEEVLSSAARNAPRDIAGIVHSRLAMVHTSRGSRDLAEKHFGLAMKMCVPGEMPWVAMARGANLARIGELKRACKYYRLASKDGELADEAFLNLGLAHRAMGDYSAAARFLKRVVHFRPSSDYAGEAATALKSLPSRSEIRLMARKFGVDSVK